MTSTARQPVPLQTGVVVRLNSDAGFGYVRNETGDRQYIFVFGAAIKRAQAGKLAVGQPVRFRISGKDRVDELVAA